MCVMDSQQATSPISNNYLDPIKHNNDYTQHTKQPAIPSGPRLKPPSHTAISQNKSIMGGPRPPFYYICH